MPFGSHIYNLVYDHTLDHAHSKAVRHIILKMRAILELKITDEEKEVPLRALRNILWQHYDDGAVQTYQLLLNNLHRNPSSNVFKEQLIQFRYLRDHYICSLIHIHGGLTHRYSFDPSPDDGAYALSETEKKGFPKNHILKPQKKDDGGYVLVGFGADGISKRITVDKEGNYSDDNGKCEFKSDIEKKMLDHYKQVMEFFTIIDAPSLGKPQNASPTKAPPYTRPVEYDYRYFGYKPDEILLRKIRERIEKIKGSETMGVTMSGSGKLPDGLSRIIKEMKRSNEWDSAKIIAIKEIVESKNNFSLFRNPEISALYSFIRDEINSHYARFRTSEDAFINAAIREADTVTSEYLHVPPAATTEPVSSPAADPAGGAAIHDGSAAAHDGDAAGDAAAPAGVVDRTTDLRDRLKELKYPEGSAEIELPAIHRPG